MWCPCTPIHLCERHHQVAAEHEAGRQVDAGYDIVPRDEFEDDEEYPR